MPGEYSPAQLRFQAENVAASIANNASFNCIATKMIITWANWPQRTAFLDLIDEVLAKVPPRRAYYPGATDRFEHFTGQRAPANANGTLPWTLVRDTSQIARPRCSAKSRSCACVAKRRSQPPTRATFLARAVRVCQRAPVGHAGRGRHGAAQFSPRRGRRSAFQSALAELRYGAVGVNHWPALVYAMMSPPWGGHPSGTLADAQSGNGSVHNTFELAGVQKTVLEGPLTVWPKPFWFPTNRRPETGGVESARPVSQTVGLEAAQPVAGGAGRLAVQPIKGDQPINSAPRASRASESPSDAARMLGIWVASCRR